MDLEAVCDAIARRHNIDEPVDCLACRQSFGGVRQLWEHLDEVHDVAQELPCYDNLVDVEKFVGLVPLLTNRQLTPRSDEILACFLRVADEPTDSERHEDDGRAFEDDDDDAFDDGIPTQCLFCSETTTNVEHHMKTDHGFALRSSALFSNKTMCSDEYARMRLINAVRRAVLNGKCPQCEETVPNVAEHVATSGHYLPVRCPEGDEWLLPVLPGDGMMTLVMDDDEGEDADESSRYPMVPTVGDVIRLRREHPEQQQ
jgi:hypothetical protein